MIFTKKKGKAETRSLLDPKSPSLLPKLILVTLISQLIVIVMVVSLTGAVFALGNAKQPTYVIDEAGNPYPVRTVAKKDPQPEEITSFVQLTFYQLFDWRGLLPPSAQLAKMERDPGVPIKTAKTEHKISTQTWKASFRIEDPFRREFIKTLAQLTPPEIFEGKGAQAFFVPERVDAPQKEKDQGWRVRIQGMLMIFTNGDNLGEAVPVKYDVFIHERRGFKPADLGTFSNSVTGRNAIKSAEAEAEAAKIPVSDLQKIVYDNTERFSIYAMREFQ
jgi:hypothetical protein